MTQHGPNPADSVTLRDALRGLRHAMRRGGETLFDMPVAALPGPAAQIAGAMLRHGGELAKGVDEVASSLAKRLLGPGPQSAASFPEIAGDSNAATRFATACYVALQAALKQMGVTDALIVESAARMAYRRIAPQIGHLPEPRIAADLTLQMLELRVLHGAGEAAPLASFAVLLWLQSDRREDEDQAALEAAVDLARVLADDLRAACAAQDADRLQQLYAEFVNHV